MRSIFFNKGQSRGGGGSAAALIAIITFLIVLYIVFLPAQDRDDLLDTTTTSGSTRSNSRLNNLNETLLVEHPGRIDFLSKQSVDHLLPSVNLVSRTEGSVLEEENSLYVRKAAFSEKINELGFEVEDLDNIENVLLTFVVKQASGRLIIILNEREVFNAEITEKNIEPIKIKKRDLKNINKITFGVSGPGAAFWKINEYLLENIKVIADVTDTSGRKAVSVFTTDSSEAENVDKVKVKFTPDCRSDTLGKLAVSLNTNELFNAIPDCGTPFIQEYSGFYIVEGENRVEFSTDKGSYLIDPIEITSQLKEARDYTYDFTVNSTAFKAIQAGNLKVNLSMEFVKEDDNDREAQLIINGRKLLMDTNEDSWDRIIDVYVEEDYNYIKIIPKRRMFVSELRIETQKK